MSASRRLEKLWFLDTLVRIHVSGDSNADGMSIIEHRAPQGSSPPLHIHHHEDEIFHVLAGKARFLIDDREVHAGPGDTVLAPKGLPHSFVATSPDGLRWLTATTRGDFERMIRSLSRPAKNDGLPPHNGHPSAAEAAVLAAACRENRIELIGPPLA